MTADWTDALKRARAHAPYLARGLELYPEIADLLAQGDGEAALEEAKRAAAGVDDVGLALRREKRALATALAIGDLAGAFDLDKVMRELSLFADRAMHRAIEAAIARRVEGAPSDGMIALALGKHGSGELNYSSDIDPILLYDPETLARRERDEPGEAAQRYAREMVRMLSDVTSEGYVFRVDLRLRPASEVSPLAIPLDAAITHYESSALAWERAAFIRARSCAGDIAAGEKFLDQIRPFVWRRSLDFGAIDAVRQLTRRIREQQTGPTAPAPDYNVKLGRGGIREIEFFAQTHQLIHGGRNPELRDKRTRAALDALADAGHIDKEDAASLGAAYDGLRRIEHRLQMVGDRQTHTLPEAEALDNVARLDGFADGAAWLEHIASLTAPVARSYDALLAEDEVSVPSDSPHVEPVPARKELDAGLVERVAGWTDGRYPPLRSTAALSAFEAIRAPLLDSLASAKEPERAAARWESLLSKLSSAINLFRLLEARPGLFQLLADCLTLAPPLADAIALRPELVDALIDRTALDLPGERGELAAEMRRGERGDTYEDKLDRIRIVTGEARFALGVQVIETAHDPLDIAAALSRVAEAAIEFAQEAAEAEFAERHGRIADSELVVLGLGRLGGGMLTHASDLDVVYLFTGSLEGESDGERPLGATLYYNRLAQRVSAALSVPTAEGALYEVDTRLRPQGAQGPLAVSLESFLRYQSEDAWTWEHMALTRARALTGSAEARRQVDKALREVLCRKRSREVLIDDVRTMRADMATHKPARGPLDIKLLRGGLVDLEFLVHYLQLREGEALTPRLDDAIAQLAARDLIPSSLGQAHDLMTRLLVGTRLLAPDLAIPEKPQKAILSRLCRVEKFRHLRNALDEAREQVAEQWSRLLEEQLEIER
ncbi:bifunctional [glutamate--ammonia ligase]-adenylyl-L-tyrosine phosphorylase/[glutamate--ammonia-ligase] adenylyltransferase [Erythrobacter aquimaris]|uniref:Bifunctional [glutamate--ammonia ligase]-adenylyl-L-tyrosine phosphorylase/[glutamate--ammonia-ligase] adenylyltransferase n=1 Tax=Qipengyuania aquimaris TaxID=255984 RepID=A0A6I4TLC2_9SPHN|nr:bifunctional [glutamate--ammonia ligase]-adenylyl-L-tyrosine phosphorylase/[glutamate--ammonia-ligase] adenylyltransferase [Qipengyuania aquimaris]MXO96785.1 bifunctional [glutamate--ammonia ligase]-adenylyl-L-tyrosine phosphorylase/[glutamate--ammonia-ligase] adenylyltransferase [Qipengyuania aquimaris]